MPDKPFVVYVWRTGKPDKYKEYHFETQIKRDTYTTQLSLIHDYEWGLTPPAISDKEAKWRRY